MVSLCPQRVRAGKQPHGAAGVGGRELQLAAHPLSLAPIAREAAVRVELEDGGVDGVCVARVALHAAVDEHLHAGHGARGGME